MPRGPHYVDSRGICIYCGASGPGLSDEHVVPYSLGGSHVLRKASCNTCADITKKFEQKVARDLWGDARIAFDAPSRRKAKRPKKFNIPNANGRGEGLAIPSSEYPAGFVFYKMCQAGLLQGLPEDVDVSGSWRLIIIDDDKRRKKFQGKYPNSELRIKFRHVPQDFGRLIAKVGYGHVLTQIEPEDFKPICLPYILGHRSNVSYVVGGTFEEQAPEADNGYLLETAGFGSAERLILVALVRLLANTSSPAYHVVVGEVVGSQRVELVMRKLGVDGKRAPLFQSNTDSSLPHWLPHVTPLPFVPMQ